MRILLLETMVNRLTERCLTKTVYASPSSGSMDEAASRDLCEKSKFLVKQLNNVSGNAQGIYVHICIPKFNKIDIIFPFRYDESYQS